MIANKPEDVWKQIKVVGTTAENTLHASSSGAFKPGQSGILGVGFDYNRQYWTAHGWRKGKRVNLYTGPHFEKALCARKKWEIDNYVSFEDITHENI
ncbi:MAG: hypothetical protein M0Z85_10325 [Gammaproteobacteria bacterium]|nr:hypothetical protein [Gammaproteobacteria bacterium]